MMKVRLFILLPIFVLTGCATLAETENSTRNSIIIEKIDSQLAEVGNVSVTQTEPLLHVRGEVLRKTAGRGPIYGHVHIEAFGVDNRPLIDVEDNYRRRSTKVRSARFSEKLNIGSVEVKKVRITHHAQRHPY